MNLFRLSMIIHYQPRIVSWMHYSPNLWYFESTVSDLGCRYVRCRYVKCITKHPSFTRETFSPSSPIQMDPWFPTGVDISGQELCRTTWAGAGGWKTISQPQRLRGQIHIYPNLSMSMYSQLVHLIYSILIDLIKSIWYYLSPSILLKSNLNLSQHLCVNLIYY